MNGRGCAHVSGAYQGLPGAACARRGTLAAQHPGGDDEERHDQEDPGRPGRPNRSAGAAEQLTDALLVNPNDKFEVAEAIRDALYMDRAERVARWERMMATLRRSDVSWWAATFLKDLTGPLSVSRARTQVHA